MDLTNVEIYVPKDLKDVSLPTPEELAYWNLFKHRTFFIDYEIEDDYRLIELSKYLIIMNMEEISIPKEELKPIYIFIHSYGGDLDQAYYLCDLIQSSRIPIITIATGSVMSAGFLIFIAGKKRYAFKQSSLLVHQGSASFTGSASEIEEAQKNYKRQLAMMKTYILENTEIDEKTFKKNQQKDWYLTSEELVKYKIVDKLIDSFEDIIQ